MNLERMVSGLVLVVVGLGGCAIAPAPAPEEESVATTQDALSLAGDEGLGVGYGDIAKMAYKVLEMNKGSLPPELADMLFSDPIDYKRLAEEFAAAAREETYLEYAAKLEAYHKNMRDAELMYKGNRVWRDAFTQIDAVRQQVNETSQQFARKDLERRALASYVASQQLKFTALEKLIAIDPNRPVGEPSRAEGMRLVMRADLAEAIAFVTRVKGDIVWTNAMAMTSDYELACKKHNAWCDKDGCTKPEWSYLDPTTRARNYFDAPAPCETSRFAAWPRTRDAAFGNASKPLAWMDEVLASWRETLDTLDKNDAAWIVRAGASAKLGDGTLLDVSPWLRTTCTTRNAPCEFTPTADMLRLPASGLAVTARWTCSKDGFTREKTASAGQKLTLECKPLTNLVAGATRTNGFGSKMPVSTCNGQPECLLEYPSTCPNTDVYTWTCSQTKESRQAKPTCIRAQGMEPSKAVVKLSCPQ